ncbi:transaldolase A [Candidatus Blochmanniella pennsylvanica str. BPEN]|uniref:Transaldolase A n=1 Tax=Blochmanniella pennsylvanica (strain BPEN) TaxID=291272 RepID=Q492F9_BLOPB|nr:transaldolase family protein [Candidatus Blochmannia pennsylvanicus]AAZ41142.1 transaldolase A [Candidatus Blochmannia pennsylvanicus str. BPEN]
MNPSSSLRKISVIVENIKNIDTIRYYYPHNNTIANPLLILKPFFFSSHCKLIEYTIIYTIKKYDVTFISTINTINELKAHIDTKILDNIPRYVFIKMDIISSSNKYFKIKKYHRFIAIYKNQKTDPVYFIIKITINWKIIKKTTEFQKNNIQINLTFLLSLYQRCACTKLNLCFIYPFINLICNWYSQYVLFNIYNYSNIIQKINKSYFNHNKYYEKNISINTNLCTDNPIMVTDEYDCLINVKKLLKKHNQLILHTQPIKFGVFSFLNKKFNKPISVYKFNY